MSPKAEYLTLGMYSHGNFYGITNNTLQRPNLVRYLNNFARKHLPREAQWTSITLSRNNQLPVHKDNHNHPRYQNYGIGLGEYTGGELWLGRPHLTEQSQNTTPQVHPNGSQLWGETKATRHKVVSFDPKEWHCTCPWQGNRIMMTCFVSRGWGQANEEVERGAIETGFRMFFGRECVSGASPEALQGEIQGATRKRG